MPVSRTEGCLPLVSFSYTDPIVGVSEVDLREYCRASEAIQKLVDERQGVSIFDGDGIQATVVDTKA